MTLRLIVHEEDGNTLVLLRLPGVDDAVPFGAVYPFASPLTAGDFEDLRFYLEDYANLPPREFAARGERVDRERLDACGEALYNAIFAGHPRRSEAYLRARLAIEGRKPVEVSIRSSDPRFLALPWELMKAPEARNPLSVRVDTFDRTLPGNETAREFASTADGFRVLMMTPRPAGIGDGTFPAVARPLLRHLETAKSAVRVAILRPPSFEAFRKALKEAKEAGAPYHAVHFDGYGVFAQMDGSLPPQFQLQEEVLQSHAVFELDGGEPDLVSALAFAAALAEGDVPLVILSACQARNVQPPGAAPCPGAAMAVELLQEGAASVVVMRQSLYAVAAAGFMAAFYEELLAGKSVSEAVNTGRKALREESNRLRPSLRGGIPLQDWFVPVHFSRSVLRLPQGEARPEPAFPAEETVGRVLDAARAAEGLPAGGLAAEGDMFFGRDAEFFLLERAIRTHHLAVIHGVGGAGTTELAKGFARWLQVSGGVDDPQFVFFHSFEPGRPAFGLDLVANEIVARSGNAKACPDAEITKKRAELALRILRDHRCLLIWDNFSTAASLPDPSRTMLPLDEAGQADLLWFLAELRNSKSALLITSRSKEDWLGGPETALRCEVRGLSERDVLQYANRLLAPHPQANARRAAEPGAFKALLDHLGGHPLTLKLILPLLSKSCASVLLEGLKGQGTLPPGFGASQGRLQSLGESLYYSFRHLADKDQRRLVILSLFEKVVSANMLGAMKDAPEPFQGFSPQAWDALLGRLSDIGLLTSLGGGLYQLHPALPPYLGALWQTQTEAPGEAGPEREAALGSLIGAAANSASHLRRQIWTEEARAALDQIGALRASFCTFLAAALKRNLFAEAQTLILTLNEYWDSAELVPEAQTWSEYVIGAIEPKPYRAPEAGTPAHDLWLSVMASDGNRAFQAGDFGKAYGIYHRIVGSLERDGGGKPDRSLADAYYKLSLVEQERGVLDEAEAWAGKSLAIFEALNDPLDKALGYHQLGAVAQLRNQAGEAEEWYKKSVALHESLVGQPQMAATYQQLAHGAQEHGRQEEAEGWYRKSVAIEEAMGNMGHSYYQLGLLAQDRGHPSEAEGWYKKSLSIDEALGNRPGKAQDYRQLGAVAQLRGRSGEAEDWLRQSVATEEALNNQPGIARSSRLLGTVLHERGHFEEAEGWYKKSLAIEEVLGSQPGMAGDFYQLGLLARDSGSPGEAEGWAMKAFAIFDMLGDELDKAKALALMAELKSASPGDKGGPPRHLWTKLRRTFAQSAASGKAGP